MEDHGRGPLASSLERADGTPERRDAWLGRERRLERRDVTVSEERRQDAERLRAAGAIDHEVGLGEPDRATEPTTGQFP
jgi:hypothetical protein